MREVKASEITKHIRKMCIDSCCYLPKDIYQKISDSKKAEKSSSAIQILDDILKNADIAKDETVPICQDTGIAVIFIEVGQDVHIVGNLEEAINLGVAEGYIEGYLRKSVVAEPLFERQNTKNNAPAIIHYKIVSGDKINIYLAPKGAGSENKSALKMLIPADGIAGVKQFVLDTVKLAGPNACPPLVVGVGIGGDLEQAAICAKKACIRDSFSNNPDPRYAKLEDELLELVNKTGIGPQGLGGSTTVLKVNVEYYPTHIAMLPVAVNINCNVARHVHLEI